LCYYADVKTGVNEMTENVVVADDPVVIVVKPVNGAREMARRVRQIAAGQLKEANGLRIVPIVVLAKPKRKAAPRKPKAVAESGSTVSI
jgi:hypothetical protein